MAKLKTFASGSPLTAADVNQYLNPEVPEGATSIDTGIISVAAGSGFTSTAARVMRNGLRVLAAGALVTSGSTTFDTALKTIGTIPDAAGDRVRPTYSLTATVAVYGGGMLQVIIYPSGAITARTLSGSFTVGAGASIYLDTIAWDL